MTEQKIHSMPSNEAYRRNWEAAFGKKEIRAGEGVIREQWEATQEKILRDGHQQLKHLIKK